MERLSRRLLTRVALAAIIALPARAVAQLSTARGLFVARANDSVPSRWMSRAEVFTSFEASLRRARTFQSSDYRLGLIVDVVRIGESTSLGLVLGSEMKVAPDNSIGFDPRGIIWEEQGNISTRLYGMWWNASLFLRCRHDVDNGTPVEALDASPTILAEGRVIALHGAQIGVAVPEWQLTRRLAVRLGGQIESYLIHEDIRTPKSAAPPDWEAARGALALNARVRFALSERWSAYARSWESHVLFNRAGASVLTNARAEIGFHVSGPAGGGDIFVARERAFDDAMSIQPRHTVMSGLGVRLSGGNVF